MPLESHRHGFGLCSETNRVSWGSLSAPFPVLKKASGRIYQVGLMAGLKEQGIQGHPAGTIQQVCCAHCLCFTWEVGFRQDTNTPFYIAWIFHRELASLSNFKKNSTTERRKQPSRAAACVVSVHLSTLPLCHPGTKPLGLVCRPAPAPACACMHLATASSHLEKIASNCKSVIKDKCM